MSAYSPPEEEEYEDPAGKAGGITEERFKDEDSASVYPPNPVSSYRQMDTYDKVKAVTLGTFLTGSFGSAYFMLNEGAREGAAELLRDLGIDVTGFLVQNPEGMEYVRQVLESGI